MMKKLLVLALVLSMAVVANAGLSFEGGKISYSQEQETIGGINVYVGSVDVAIAELMGFVGRTGAFPLAPTSAPVFTAYTGEDAIGAGLPWVLGFVQVSWGDPVTTPNPAGFWFSFDAPAGARSIDVMDGYGVIPMETVQLPIPEPMTMVLLGLGGLFLRKKK